VLVLQQVAGELFPNAFWLVTSWTAEQMPAEDYLLEHYRQRGTAEAHMGELMDFAHNQVRLRTRSSGTPRPAWVQTSTSGSAGAAPWTD